MRRSKKFVLVTALAAVVLIGSITGAVLADDGNGNEPGALFGALRDRVAEIYQQKTGDTLDQEALQEAFATARAEMREEAMKNRLETLVDEGTITQDEADQWTEWWQSKPDVPLRFGFRARCGPLGGGGLQAPQPAE